MPNSLSNMVEQKLRRKAVKIRTYKRIRLNIKPVRQSLYPTATDINSVVDIAMDRLPIYDRSVLFALLMMMQNTIIKETSNE